MIGLGRMGRRHFTALAASPRWQLAWACDRDPDSLAWAQQSIPGLRVGTDGLRLMREERERTDAVGVFTLADARPGLIERALDEGLHVLAEKPLGSDAAQEERLLARIESSGRLVVVNLFNRNTWYHQFMIDFVRSGQLGRLVSIEAVHLTPDLLPTEGHQPEGPPFRDCGMHYVDLVCWYAGSDFAEWDARGLRLWDWPDPWWVDVHGHFRNGTLFRIAQTFGYGQQAEQVAARSQFEVVGSHGVVRMRHDFAEVIVECHGRSSTVQRAGPYQGKRLDVLAERFADVIEGRAVVDLPSAADSVAAARTAEEMLCAARRRSTAIGTAADLDKALRYRAALKQQGRAFPEALLT
ncbi:Gfo/Idh/MocA family protein [Microlunatus parietis]|uniref:Gfo/Idh/MocA family protein n=1 Tax=Microlunatus parietis TaxID=682979 RepID=UPI0028B0E5A5|nr:Gfo/Idh/MocA family oxidoreductase [Microlunatus parietis]